MLVKNWMSKEVVTVHVNDSMQDAVKLLREHSIRILPVMEQGELDRQGHEKGFSIRCHNAGFLRAYSSCFYY